MIFILIIVKWAFANFTPLNLAFLTLKIMILTFIKIQSLTTFLRTVYFLIVTLIEMFSVLFKSNLFLEYGAMLLITLNKLFISRLQSNLDHGYRREILVSTHRTLVTSFLILPLRVAIFTTHRHFTLLANLRLICHHSTQNTFKWI